MRRAKGGEPRGTLGTGLAILLLCAGPVLAQSLTRAEQPQVKVGDASIYQERNVLTGETKETRFRLTAIDAGKIVIDVAGSTSGTQTYTRDWNLIEVKTGELVTDTFKPFRPALQFPLQVGRSWTMPFEVEARDRNGERHAQWQWSARVASVEPVTVPAGTFQAFRIDYDGSFTTREKDQTWTGSHKETAWYAPAVNRIVKRDYEQVVPSRKFVEHHVIEMLSFTPAK